MTMRLGAKGTGVSRWWFRATSSASPSDHRRNRLTEPQPRWSGLVALRAHSRKEIHPRRREQNVGRPRRDYRRQQAHVSQLLEQPANRPVSDRNREAHAHARHGTAITRQKRERHRDQRHHQREQRQRELAVETYLQRDGVDAAPLQVANVGRQLLVVHLLILQHLLQEVIRTFVDFRKRRGLAREILELLVLAPRILAAPSVLENPGAQRWLPAR